MIWRAPGAFNYLSRLLGAMLVTAMPAASFAITALPFAPVRQPLTEEIAQLSSLPSPTSEQLIRLRALTRANDVLERTALPDGKALRALRLRLARLPEYTAPLDTVASNLVAVVTNRYNFVGTLLRELPPSAGATNVSKQFGALDGTLTKLRASVNVTKTGALYDLLRARLDKILTKANKLLLVEFPLDLAPNQVDATINGSYFKTTATAATENLFSAVATETNITVTVSAIDYPRAILFSIPNVQFGTFRYTVPDQVVFTNRTALYVSNNLTGTSISATNGVFFINASSTEVYGLFDCSGPDFEVTRGRFRMNVSSQP